MLKELSVKAAEKHTLNNIHIHSTDAYVYKHIHRFSARTWQLSFT